MPPRGGAITYRRNGRRRQIHTLTARAELGGYENGSYAGSVSGLTAGSAHDLRVQVGEAGDYAYRSGVFTWAVGQGMWGAIRAEGPVEKEG